MAKKLSASSRPEKLVRVSAGRIFSKPITKAQSERLARLAKKPDSAIDVSDIPPLTDEQLAQMVPYRLRSKTTLISFRVQNDVLTWLKSKGLGHYKPDQCDSRQRDGRRTATEEHLSPWGPRPAILSTTDQTGSARENISSRSPSMPYVNRSRKLFGPPFTLNIAAGPCLNHGAAL